jgi:hypothetical protein
VIENHQKLGILPEGNLDRSIQTGKGLDGKQSLLVRAPVPHRRSDVSHKGGTLLFGEHFGRQAEHEKEE